MYDSADIMKENLFSQSKVVWLLELDLQAQPTGSNPRISICEIKATSPMYLDPKYKFSLKTCIPTIVLRMIIVCI